MSNQIDGVVVTAGSPYRGTQTQLPLAFRAERGECSWAWGLQPATALVDLIVVQDHPPIVPLASVTITIGGHTFYGIPEEVVQVSGTAGNWLALRFVDMRWFLQQDVVYGLFNRRENRLVNGQFVRRFFHILPADFDTQTKTYTNAPLTGVQILNYLFAAPTVSDPWQREYHAQLNGVIYELDCTAGRKLGEAVLEVSSRLGTVFTLFGQWGLFWALKGVGTLPGFPANSDSRRVGTKLSGNPSRVRVLGGRNLYQVLNLALEPDWLPAFVPFYDPAYLADDLFDHEVLEATVAGIAAGTPFNAIPGDVDQLTGSQLALARALTITVGEYAKLRDARDGQGAAFRDGRKFAGRSRLSMPMALYIQVLLFRAYRPPAGWQLVNQSGAAIGVYSLAIEGRGLVEVTHDPVDGGMSWSVDVVTATNGYAIAQGYQVASDAFRTLHPARFDITAWLSQQSIWERCEFQTDDSGEGTEFIIFDRPIVRSGDLIQEVNINGAGNDYPALKANPTFVPVPVRAGLVFAAERFSVWQGSPGRDEAVAVEGLNAEYVVDGTAMWAGQAVELPYANGLTATQQGVAVAGTVLNGQYYYPSGGYRVMGSNQTQLSSLVDRVTVRVSPEGGLEEEVDWTAERSRLVDAAGRVMVEPERDFERRESLQPLLPGQRELKVQAEQERLIGVAFKQNRRLAETVSSMFHRQYGFDAPPDVVRLGQATGGAAPAGNLAVGTPIWQETDPATLAAGNAKAALPLPPGSAVVAPALVGVTVMDGERAAGSVRVTSTGIEGVVLVRVQGPVQPGDVVGLATAPNDPHPPTVRDCLVAKGRPAVGRALDQIALVGPVDSNGNPTTTQPIRFIQVNTQAGTGMAWRGQYDPKKSYQVDDVVYVPQPADPVNPPVIGMDILADGTSGKVWSIAGQYIAVQPVPRVPLDPPDPTHIYPPRYPYPVIAGGTPGSPQTVVDGKRVYWHLMSLGTLAIPDCDEGGNEITAWGDTQPVPVQ